MHPAPAMDWYPVAGFGILVLLVTAIYSYGPLTAGAYPAQAWRQGTGRAVVDTSSRVAWMFGAGILAALWLYGWMALAAGKI